MQQKYVSESSGHPFQGRVVNLLHQNGKTYYVHVEGTTEVGWIHEMHLKPVQASEEQYTLLEKKLQDYFLRILSDDKLGGSPNLALASLTGYFVGYIERSQMDLSFEQFEQLLSRVGEIAKQKGF